MKTKIGNLLRLILFCALIGAASGIILWVFLKVMTESMHFLWEWLPEKAQIPFYSVIVCTAGGVLIGLFRKKYGDYPEELDTVIGKVKTEKRYGYSNMAVMIIAALLPLIIGSSVGPESGMAGIIVGLCYWAGDNLKFAGKNARAYSELGMAATLSVLFQAPLFGIFAVEEGEENSLTDLKDQNSSLGKGNKIFVYGIALAAAAGCSALLSSLFGKPMEGFPSFSTAQIERADFLMVILYIICGGILAKFYDLTHSGCHRLAEKLPAVVREGTAGLILGLAGMAVPAVMFSGEEQMGELMGSYTEYLPWMLIFMAFFKILITNICIQSGLKGGHFFPVIFAGVCLGYGVSMIAFPGGGDHVIFAAATVTAALLGANMKKPVAVTMLLFLCFPVKMFFWIFLAAAAGSRIFGSREEVKEIENAESDIQS